jgi:hypothetical protein
MVGFALYLFVMPETQRGVPAEAEAIRSKAVLAAE